MAGLLRFSPDSKGVYIARCAPDYFILPALAKHFTLRFGETPWVIIDEKRKLCLCRKNGGPARLLPAKGLSDVAEKGADAAGHKDSWEELWRLYHRSVNNESRNNPRLQQQFMPKRYQKYLPELKC
jgi:probable DNA metabolism protein